MNEVPDTVCFDVISHLYSFIKPKFTNRITVRYFDAIAQHPENALTDMGRKLSFKRWELFVEDVDYEALDDLGTELKNCPPYQGKSFDIYSDS